MVFMEHKDTRIFSLAAMAAPLIVVVATQVLCCDSKTYAQLGICSDSHRQVLIDLKNGLNDPQNRLSSWTGSNCCQWQGIGCDERTGAVISINLRSEAYMDDRYGFSGEISPSLVRLNSSLRHLDLSNNPFDETEFPEFLEDMLNLQYLNLSHALFSGQISSNFGNLSSLMYLDLSHNTYYLSVDSLERFAGMVSLKYLALSGIDLGSTGSDWARVLNKLPSLTELHLANCYLSGPIPLLETVNFTSLIVLDIGSNTFESEFPKWILNISRLVHIDMRDSHLYGKIPLGLGEIPNLKVLNLYENSDLSASCSQLFRGTWKSIEVLNLAYNNLHGKLPSSIGNMTFLTDLNLLDNNVEGGIPNTIGSLCSLVNFDLTSNNLTGSLPDNLIGTEKCVSNQSLPNLMNLALDYNQLRGHLPSWIGKLKSLVKLQLEYNLIQGPIPASLGALQNLTHLKLRENQLDGTLPTSLGQLKELSELDVSYNHLTGMLTEEHFATLSNVEILDLSDNSLTLNVSSDWMPPFQVQDLRMASCYIGPSFPTWLESQKRIVSIDMSNAGISDQIPNWFWDILSNLDLLNISMNQLQGQLPNPFYVKPSAVVDLSSNLFEGPIPLSAIGIDLLYLSNNKLSGHLPRNISKVMPNLTFLSLSSNQLKGEIPKSIGEIASLYIIDLSNNDLTGNIPPTLKNCSYLEVLDLKNNSLSGLIPPSLGHLMRLQSLHLSNNKLLGNIPPELHNLSRLETLDLGNNQLTGGIPLWLGNGFTKLMILELRSNSFSGELPGNLSNLSSLQVLDLAENHLSGTIPASFGDFKAMLRQQDKNHYLYYGDNGYAYYQESIVLNMKGQSLEYTKTLSLVTSIDLSGNNLSGGFPDEITKLAGLLVLNFSRNQVTGRIPGSISYMRQLSSLDLSSNRLYGAIPPSMSSSLTYLSYFNVSNNNLSGRIPYTGQMTTYASSSFSGNPGLCGDPLQTKCTGDDDKRENRGGEVENDPTGNDDDDEFIDRWFYMIVGVGFAAGILVPLLVLLVNKSWSDAYFGFIDRIVEKRCIAGNRNQNPNRNGRR